MKRLKESCDCDDPIMCECRELCYHMYACDEFCYDYTNGHMCKHIHSVVHKSGSEGNNQLPNTCDAENDSASDLDDPLEFAEHIRDSSKGMKICKCIQ